MYTDTGELVLEDSPHTLRPDAGHTDGAVVVVDVDTGKHAQNKNTNNLVTTPRVQCEGRQPQAPARSAASTCRAVPADLALCGTQVPRKSKIRWGHTAE